MTLLVVPVHATTSYYSGASAEASFTGALGTLTLLDPALTFAPGDLGSGGLYNASGTGVDFLGFDDLNAPGIDFTVSSGKLVATQQDERTQINFPVVNPIYAFGFHFTFVSGSATFGNWCVGLTRGACTYSVININASNVQFFGIVSDTPITGSLFIQANSGAPNIVFNDFEAYSTPEPRSLLLVGTGLLIVSLRLRSLRTRKTRQAA